MRGRAVLLLLALAGCATAERPATTNFERIDGGRFRYQARYDVAYPETSGEAEFQRMRWLQRYLHDNYLCSSGYRITKREKVPDDGLNGRLLYEGECK